MLPGQLSSNPGQQYATSRATHMADPDGGLNGCLAHCHRCKDVRTLTLLWSVHQLDPCVVQPHSKGVRVTAAVMPW